MFSLIDKILDYIHSVSPFLSWVNGQVLIFLTVMIFLGLFALLLLKEDPEIKALDAALEKMSCMWTPGEDNRKRRTVYIEEMSKSWNNPVLLLKEIPDAAGSFTHPQVTAFYEDVIKGNPIFKDNPAHRAVCISILKELDKDGDCSSVVGRQEHPDDSESKFDLSTYQLLGGITLLDHTLHVAKKASDLANEKGLRPALHNILVAALAHDVGKLPTYRGLLYQMKDHPLISAARLEETPFFDSEAFKKRRVEILNAVKLHHTKKPTGPIAEIIKEADRQARQDEMEAGRLAIQRMASEGVDEAGPKEQPKPAAKEKAPAPMGKVTPPKKTRKPVEVEIPENVDPETGEILDEDPEAHQQDDTGGEPEKKITFRNLEGEGPAPEPQQASSPPASFVIPGMGEISAPEVTPTITKKGMPIPGKTEEDPGDPWAAQEAIYGIQHEEEESKPKTTRQPWDNRKSPVRIDLPWFDLEACVERMKTRINKVRSNRFQIFSMPDGVIYCQPSFLEEIAKKQAKKYGDDSLATLPDSDPAMRQILFSMVETLKDVGLIDVSLIRDGYFSAPFRLRWKNTGKTTSVFYIPFQASAFASTVSELEKTKQHERLLNIEWVRPDTGDDDSVAKAV